MKMIKKGQTNPIYSVQTNRAFERIKLLGSKLGIVVSSNESSFPNPPKV